MPGAIAAFWFFTLDQRPGRAGAALVRRRVRHQPRLSPVAYASGIQDVQAFEYFLAVCGTLTLEGGPIFWVATHRIHHQHSDQDGDPHTPRDGGFWAHMGWILFGDTHHNNTA